MSGACMGVPAAVAAPVAAADPLQEYLQPMVANPKLARMTTVLDHTERMQLLFRAGLMDWEFSNEQQRAEPPLVVMVHELVTPVVEHGAKAPPFLTDGCMLRPGRDVIFLMEGDAYNTYLAGLQHAEAAAKQVAKEAALQPAAAKADRQAAGDCGAPSSCMQGAGTGAVMLPVAGNSGGMDAGGMPISHPTTDAAPPTVPWSAMSIGEPPASKTDMPHQPQTKQEGGKAAAPHSSSTPSVPEAKHSQESVPLELQRLCRDSVNYSGGKRHRGSFTKQHAPAIGQRQLRGKPGVGIEGAARVAAGSAVAGGGQAGAAVRQHAGQKTAAVAAGKPTTVKCTSHADAAAATTAPAARSVLSSQEGQEVRRARGCSHADQLVARQQVDAGLGRTRSRSKSISPPCSTQKCSSLVAAQVGRMRKQAEASLDHEAAAVATRQSNADALAPAAHVSVQPEAGATGHSRESSQQQQQQQQKKKEAEMGCAAAAQCEEVSQAHQGGDADGSAGADCTAVHQKLGPILHPAGVQVHLPPSQKQVVQRSKQHDEPQQKIQEELQDLLKVHDAEAQCTEAPAPKRRKVVNGAADLSGSKAQKAKAAVASVARGQRKAGKALSAGRTAALQPSEAAKGPAPHGKRQPTRHWSKPRALDPQPQPPASGSSAPSSTSTQLLLLVAVKWDGIRQPVADTQAERMAWIGKTHSAVATVVKRGKTKETSEGTPMYMFGWRNANNPYTTFGRYETDSGVRQEADRCAERAYQELKRWCPRMLLDMHEFNVEGGKGGGGATMGSSCFPVTSLTVNYTALVHLDANDAAPSFITWFDYNGRVEGGSFQLASLGLAFDPGHGTVLIIDTSRIWHGTAPCNAPVTPAPPAHQPGYSKAHATGRMSAGSMCAGGVSQCKQGGSTACAADAFSTAVEAGTSTEASMHEAKHRAASCTQRQQIARLFDEPCRLGSALFCSYKVRHFMQRALSAFVQFEGGLQVALRHPGGPKAAALYGKVEPLFQLPVSMGAEEEVARDQPLQGWITPAPPCPAKGTVKKPPAQPLLPGQGAGIGMAAGKGARAEHYEQSQRTAWRSSGSASGVLPNEGAAGHAGHVGGAKRCNPEAGAVATEGAIVVDDPDASALVAPAMANQQPHAPQAQVPQPLEPQPQAKEHSMLPEVSHDMRVGVHALAAMADEGGGACPGLRMYPGLQEPQEAAAVCPAAVALACTAAGSPSRAPMPVSMPSQMAGATPAAQQAALAQLQLSSTSTKCLPATVPRSTTLGSLHQSCPDWALGSLLAAGQSSENGRNASGALPNDFHPYVQGTVGKAQAAGAMSFLKPLSTMRTPTVTVSRKQEATHTLPDAKHASIPTANTAPTPAYPAGSTLPPIVLCSRPSQAAGLVQAGQHGALQQHGGQGAWSAHLLPGNSDTTVQNADAVLRNNLTPPNPMFVFHLTGTEEAGRQMGCSEMEGRCNVILTAATNAPTQHMVLQHTEPNLPSQPQPAAGVQPQAYPVLVKYPVLVPYKYPDLVPCKLLQQNSTGPSMIRQSDSTVSQALQQQVAAAQPQQPLAQHAVLRQPQQQRQHYREPHTTGSGREQHEQHMRRDMLPQQGHAPPSANWQASMPVHAQKDTTMEQILKQMRDDRRQKSTTPAQITRAAPAICSLRQEHAQSHGQPPTNGGCAGAGKAREVRSSSSLQNSTAAGTAPAVQQAGTGKLCPPSSHYMPAKPPQDPNTTTLSKTARRVVLPSQVSRQRVGAIPQSSKSHHAPTHTPSASASTAWHSHSHSARSATPTSLQQAVVLHGDEQAATCSGKPKGVRQHQDCVPKDGWGCADGAGQAGPTLGKATQGKQAAEKPLL